MIAFSFIGYIFLGLVAGLASIVTTQYIDYSLPSNPVVWEYDFRLGGRYGMVALLILAGGVTLALGGSGIGVYTFYEPKSDQKPLRQRETRLRDIDLDLFIACHKCGNKLPKESKFCPKCGTDITAP